MARRAPGAESTLIPSLRGGGPGIAQHIVLGPGFLTIKKRFRLKLSYLLIIICIYLVLTNFDCLISITFLKAYVKTF